VHIKALTAVEIAHLARIEKLSVTDVLIALQDAGVTSLPAEAPRCSARRARHHRRQKAHRQNGLAVHRAAHRLGLPSNCTMLYGHVETMADRVATCSRCARSRTETGGFLTYIPLAYHPTTTSWARRSPDRNRDVRASTT